MPPVTGKLEEISAKQKAMYKTIRPPISYDKIAAGPAMREV